MISDKAKLVYDSKYPQIYNDIDNNICPICKENLIKVCHRCGVEIHLLHKEVKIKKRIRKKKNQIILNKPRKISLICLIFLLFWVIFWWLL